MHAWPLSQPGVPRVVGNEIEWRVEVKRSRHPLAGVCRCLDRIQSRIHVPASGGDPRSNRRRHVVGAGKLVDPSGDALRRVPVSATVPSITTSQSSEHHQVVIFSTASFPLRVLQFPGGLYAPLSGRPKRSQIWVAQLWLGH